ncbi:DUF4157 domain-containing protein, partial [Sphingomonas sp. S2M10]|uniref:eCIS core domain-containing protein n=1 Tax=Sphingomonas sp. S2M10 TaxID=2705010 RepID=UPI0014575360
MKAHARLRATAATPATARAERGARAVPLPHHGILVGRFGQRAAHLPVVVGPAVAESLRRRGAKGASLDGVIFLPNEQVGPDLVAHEVAHALQQLQGGAAGLAHDLPGLIDRLAHAPALPASAPAEVEARSAEHIATVAPAAPVRSIESVWSCPSATSITTGWPICAGAPAPPGLAGC